MAFKTAKNTPNRGGKRGQTAAIGGRQNPHIIRKKSKTISKLQGPKNKRGFKTSATIGGSKGKQVTAYNKNLKGVKKAPGRKLKSRVRDRSISY